MSGGNGTGEKDEEMLVANLRVRQCDCKLVTRTAARISPETRQEEAGIGTGVT